MSTSKNILIVEDEALIALDMEQTLTDAGHVVFCAASGEIAEGILREHRIDLAVVDYHLNGGTAAGLAARLSTLRIPFVVCSGSSPQEQLREVFGEAPYLPKPFSAEALLNSVGGLGTRQDN